MDSARHVIKRNVNSRLVIQLRPYGVAGIIHQFLPLLLPVAPPCASAARRYVRSRSSDTTCLAIFWI